METETTPKKKWHNIDISGRWLLTYTVGNELGPEAFGGKHLGLYKSPFDGTKVYRRSVDDRPLNGYMMDKLGVQLFPDENLDHKYLINWLICHNEVQLAGIPNVDPIILKAKTGNKLTLKALDFLEMEVIDDEDFVDKVVGRLLIDRGEKAIGIDKLRHILAALNMPYQDNRFTGLAEKKALRSKLKKFTRSSIENAKLVKNAINNLDASKERWMFKEMLRLHVLADYGGQYKFNNVPVGSSFEKVQSFFSDNPEVKAEAVQELYNKLK